MPSNTRGTGWLTEAVAAEIRSLMGRQGLRQVELANLSGIHKATVSTIVHARSAIDLEQIDRLSRALRIEPDELLRSAIQHARQSGLTTEAADTVSNGDGVAASELVEGRDYVVGTPSQEQLAALTPEKVAELLRQSENPE